MRDFSWAKLLPTEAFNEFIHELAEAVAGDADLGPLLASWQATAEVYGDPELPKTLTTPADEDFGPVPMPGE
jgi:hypothetical protein